VPFNHRTTLSLAVILAVMLEEKRLEGKPASQGITGLAESFEKVAKSAAAAALIFLIFFGCCYKWGEDHGQDAGRQIRLEKGKHILKTLPSGEAVLFWKDDKIIQGGLYGFLTVAVLSTYVVLLFILLKPSPEKRGEWVAFRLRYPNIMSASVGLVLFSLAFRLRFDLADATALTVLMVFAACSWRSRSRLAIQIMLLVGQALLLSFLYGESRGIASADFEHYPLVEVRDTGGGVTKGLRLLKTDDSECRFVDSEGREQMIPKAQIRAISVVPESVPGAK
jgi:hypothetical protein